MSYGMVSDSNGEYVTYYECEKVVASVASRAMEQIDSIKSVHEAEVARLRAEVEKNRVDAERYRWLRNPDQDVSLVLDKVTGYVEYHEGTQTGGYNTYEFRAGDELDKAIDAAIGASA